MKAVVFDSPGGPEVLKVGERPRPEVKDGQVIVRVVATALNRADTLQRMGKYPPPAGESDILGLECAGVVEEVGSNVENVVVGDRVCALLSGGGYAEYVAVPADMCMKVAEGYDMKMAAGLPEAFLTAFQAVEWIAGLKAGESIMIHAGASGVGAAAIQLAKLRGAKTIIATASSDEKLAFCRELGATHTINYKEGPFPDAVKAATDGLGVNVVIDFVMASYWNMNLESLALDGRMVMLATLGGINVDGTNLATILRKRLQITGSTLRTRSLDYKVRLTKDFSAHALDDIMGGGVKVMVDRVFPMEEASAAHAHMEANRNRGKIILSVCEQ